MIFFAGNQRLPYHRVTDWARELLDDLQSMEEVADSSKDELLDTGSSLTLKRLKNNIVRFGRAGRPLATLSEKWTMLQQWNSPTASLLVFLVMQYYDGTFSVYCY